MLPVPNPNNKPQQQQKVFLTVPNNYPAYALNISDIHLRSGTTLPTPSPPVIMELPSEEIAQDTPVRTHPFPQRLQVEVSRQQDDKLLILLIS